jgi:hypothetical protein
VTGDGHIGPNGEDHGDSHDDGDDDLDSDGYGPGEGYYPDGGYKFARFCKALLGSAVPRLRVILASPAPAKLSATRNTCSM